MFCNDERNVRVEPGRVVLSQIFEWYEEDFTEFEAANGNPGGDQVDYINRFRSDDELVPTGLEVEFVEYDWTINSQRQEGGRPIS